MTDLLTTLRDYDPHDATARDAMRRAAARLDLAERIIEACRYWSAHDPHLLALLREWAQGE